MALPEWTEIKASLTEAIRAALPLQLNGVDGDRIAGVGLHMDSYYGAAGLYLLPEAAANGFDPTEVNNIGNWPISTDWDASADDAVAFASHWGQWSAWFDAHLEDLTEAENEEKARGLLRLACEAMRQIEADGLLDSFPKTDGFRVIIAEHDEPDEWAVERYGLFIRTGEVRCHALDAGM
jgi:hypothetical protein